MPEIRIGMIGAGKVASWHLRAYRGMRDVRIAGIANPGSQRGPRIASRYGIPRHWRDGLDMLGEAELDAVDVCTPDRSHKVYILAALKKGLHVYTEKPMCETVGDADEVIRANRTAQRILFNGFNYRYMPSFRRISSIVRAGALGEIRYVRMTRTTRDSRQYSLQNERPAEAFTGFHCHFIDLLFAFGFDEPVDVCAHGVTVLDWPVRPDTAALTLRYESGAIAEITTSQASPGLTPELMMIGTRATLRLAFGRVRVVRQRDEWRTAALLWNLARESMILPWRVLRNPFAGACRHFVDCVRRGRRSESDEHAARRTLRVCEAATKSYLEGKHVTVGPPA